MPTALVVDDERDIRELCELNLRFDGWDVVGAGSLAAARALLDERTPDWIILDLRLRDGSGWDLLREIRIRPRTRAVPVLLLSASVDDSADLDCWEPGLLERLSKPFLPADLAAAAARVGTASVDAEAHAERVRLALPT